MGAGIPPSQELSDEDLSLIHPVIEMYNTVMKCKNLGITLPASSLTPELLDLIHEYYTQVEEARAKRKDK